MITPLDRLPMNFPLFRLVQRVHSRVFRSLNLSSSVEDRIASSIPVHSWYLWTLMLSTLIRLYVQKSQTSLSEFLIIMIFLMVFKFKQETQI